MANETAPPPDPDPGSGLSAIANGVAIVLIGVYLVALAVQWFDVGLVEPDWSRRLQLLGGLEALAFAGAGAVLGTTVQRQVTKKAEQQAAEAGRRAEANRVAAEKGKAMQAYAEAKARRTAQAQPAEPGTRDLGGPVEPTTNDWTELLDVARRYDESS
jgi:hypothetical protein